MKIQKISDKPPFIGRLYSVFSMDRIYRDPDGRFIGVKDRRKYDLPQNEEDLSRLLEEQENRHQREQEEYEREATRHIEEQKERRRREEERLKRQEEKFTKEWKTIDDMMKYARKYGIDVGSVGYIDRTNHNETAKRIYRALALFFHPDTNKGKEKEAEENFKRLQTLWDNFRRLHRIAYCFNRKMTFSTRKI